MATDSSMPTVDLDQVIDVKQRVEEMKRVVYETERKIPHLKYGNEHIGTPLREAVNAVNQYLSAKRASQLQALKEGDPKICVLVDHDGSVLVVAGRRLSEFIEAEQCEKGLLLNKYTNTDCLFREIAGYPECGGCVVSGFDRKMYEIRLEGVVKTIKTYRLFFQILTGRVLDVHVLKASYLTRWNRAKTYGLDLRIKLMDTVADDITKCSIKLSEDDWAPFPKLSDHSHCFYDFSRTSINERD